MKILIHSNAPWVPSGYGKQCALLLPELVKLGHEPAVSAFSGLHGAPIDWRGYTIFPSGALNFGPDVIVPHARTYEAELVLFLMDFWQMMPAARDLADLPTAAWLPNDCRPLGRGDRTALAVSRTTPIAMSRWGQDNITTAGWRDAPYVPHMVDTELFRPMPDRAAARANMGVHDRFVIGILAANRDSIRKGFPEQFRAFALFRKKHPEAVLWVHTLAQGPGGHDLIDMAEQIGITGAVEFSETYPQVAGLLPDSALVPWFNCLDVLSNCSYAEAFGVPIVEAQACGTPVVVTHGASMTELCGSGWTVPGSDYYNPIHAAWWTRPSIPDIAATYERAWQALHTVRGAERYRHRARSFARAYGIDEVVTKYWAPALDALAAL